MESTSADRLILDTEAQPERSSLGVDANELRSPRLVRSSSNTSLNSTTRKRMSTLGGSVGNSASLAIPADHEPIRMRHSASPVTSPKFSQVKNVDSSLPPPPANNPVLVIPPSEVHARIAQLPLFGRRRPKVRNGRLVSVGTIIIALAGLLWFSVYQRHSALGLGDEIEAASIKRGPLYIISLVLMFLGFAALCAGISIQREEDEMRVRIVRGDSLLGRIAEHDDTTAGGHVEPTTPQHIWAAKAVSELDKA